MKASYKSIILSFLFLSTFSYAQIKGKCVDAFGKGIAYVNIAVKGKSIGTVSNQKGDFFLKYSSIKENDSLIFSHLNFNKKIVSIPLNIKKIELIPKIETLEEIVISHKKRKFKEKIVGTQTQFGDSKVKFTANKNKGIEVGKIIRIRKNKVYDVKNIQFTITDFGFKSATFRINFYNIINGVVDFEKTNRTDLIYKINDYGNVKIDLSSQQLSLHNKFLVSIEWIDFEKNHNLKEKENIILIPLVNDTGPMYSRNNVNEKWRIKRIGENLGLGIHLEVTQYSE